MQHNDNKARYENMRQLYKTNRIESNNQNNYGKHKDAYNLYM
jgi:hypothetical protein